MKTRFFIFPCTVFLWTLYLGFFVCGAECSSLSDRKVGVIVSQKIRPYMLVLEGITKGVSSQKIDLLTYYLDGKKSFEEVQKDLSRTSYDLLVGIGPEAMDVARSLNRPVIYSAVLTPNPEFSCGVSLQIPVSIQVQKIGASFPSIKRIGLLFDSLHNESFYDYAKRSASLLNMTIVPMRVSSTELLSSVLQKHWQDVDCLWMIPDPTIISASLVQYIIKQAIFQKKGVIGYNSFFIQSGALFSFEFDYEKLGRQTAEQIVSFVYQKYCSRKSPIFRTGINEKIARKLGVVWIGDTP